MSNGVSRREVEHVARLAHLKLTDKDIEHYQQDLSAILAYFEKKGISWTAWCFDPDWPPQLISDWDYTPTQQGAFFKAYMQGK